jgi:hypothetical protein
MSIERRQHDGKTIGYDVSCDSCSFSDFFEITDWKDLMVAVRAAKWRMQASQPNPATGKANWSHYGPCCTGKAQPEPGDPPRITTPKQMPLKLPKAAPQAVYDDADCPF